MRMELKIQKGTLKVQFKPKITIELNKQQLDHIPISVFIPPSKTHKESHNSKQCIPSSGLTR